MNKYKISEEEFHKVSLTRLANNPSSQSRYSGARLSAEELKMRMDEPLKLFKGKLNAVVSLIFGEGDDSALDHMPTGIKEGHTLAQMIKDVVSTSAEFAGYLSVGEKTLLKKLEEIDKAFEDINKALKGKVDEKTYEDSIKQCLKRIDGDEGVEYAYAQLNGEGRLKPMSVKPEAGSVALRGEGGRLKAGSPVEDDDVVTKGYADGTHYGASQMFAEALKGSASGEAVALKDVSPLEHNLCVRVESKNILDLSKAKPMVTGYETVDVVGNSLIVAPTATAPEMYGVIFTEGFKYTIGETYTLSIDDISDHSYEDYGFRILYADGTTNANNDLSNGDLTFMVEKEIAQIDFFIGRPYKTPQEITITNMQMEKDTTASPFTPHISDLSAVKLLAQGANLLSLDKIYRFDNCSFESGVIKQTEADTNPLVYFKVAVTLDNGEQVLIGQSDTVTVHGKVTFQFTCNEEINAFRFGLNGRVKDTTVMFEGLGLPAGTYIASCNVINATQGSISWKDMQIALIDTDYEPYKEPIEYSQGEDIKSIYPTTTIMTDTEGVLIECQYNQDANKVVAKLNDRLAALEAAVISQ